ncbi:MAG: galactosyltransferase-related protein [Dehalococcoidia bacterium]|jgi:hypothetical protein
MIGLVVTAYRLPDALIDRFVECNLPALAARGGRLYLVTDARKYLDFERENIDAKIFEENARKYPGENTQLSEGAKISERENIRALPCPDMEVFAIGRCANIGIRQALAEGCNLICKTDIDCILDEAALADIEALRPGNAAAYRYWHIPAPDRREAPKIDSIMGTFATTAEDWERVGGYDERMDGYGYDDYNVTRLAREHGIVCATKCNPKIYHIWHEQKHNRETINPVRRAQNIAIAKQIK